jgi:hypothetical protein
MLNFRLRRNSRDACLTDSDAAERSHRGSTNQAIRWQKYVGNISDGPLHRHSATSEYACHSAPSGLAAILSGRTATPELDIVHAYAEDEPHSRHSKKNTSSTDTGSITRQYFHSNIHRKSDSAQVPLPYCLRCTVYCH